MESTSRWSSYVPPLMLMAVIFFLSAQPGLNSGLGDLDLILRKLAHMTEFGLLALLWWRALGSPRAGAAIAVAYAVTDEFHQSFVDGRHGTPVDVLIDTFGVFLFTVTYREWQRRRGGGASGVAGRADARAPVVSAKDAGRANSGAVSPTEDTG